MATYTLGFPLHIYFAYYKLIFKSYSLYSETMGEKFLNFISLDISKD